MKMKGRLAAGNETIVPAGRLVLAVVQVEQVFSDHHFEVRTQLGIDAVKDGRGLCHEVRTLVKRPQRWAAQRVDVQVPRTQGPDPQAPAAPFVDACSSRSRYLLNRPMETGTVGGCVIKSVQLLPLECQIIVKAGIGRHLLTEVK
jgi:hypothetical protein